MAFKLRFELSSGPREPHDAGTRGGQARLTGTFALQPWGLPSITNELRQAAAGRCIGDAERLHQLCNDVVATVGLAARHPAVVEFGQRQDEHASLFERGAPLATDAQVVDFPGGEVDDVGFATQKQPQTLLFDR